jgi:hypothetical protein
MKSTDLIAGRIFEIGQVQSGPGPFSGWFLEGCAAMG